MNETPNQPNTAVNTPPAPTAPESQPISQPVNVFHIPEGMTAADAKARIAELNADKDFAARYFKGGQDSREGRELDALLRHSLGLQPQEQPAKPDPTAPAPEPPPENIADYRLHEPIELTAEGHGTLADLRTIALAAKLPVSWFQTISRQAALDVGRFAGLSDDEIADKVETHLHQVFTGDDYDRASAGAREIVAELERKQPGMLAKIQKAGLNRNASLLQWLMQTALDRERGKA